MTKRWVVLGADGMLGHDVAEVLRGRGETVVAAGRGDVDVTDASSVRRGVSGADVVVNCAAWTAVDDAEAQEADAFTVNAVGAATVAAASAAAGVTLVQVSTDYVFDGTASAPYPEDAPLAPRSAYGRTKAAGEWAVRAHAPTAVVVRTAWLYGAHGGCFPATIARLLTERGAVSVVDDQVGQPTWTVDVADQIARLVDAGAPGGSYAATSDGQVSWHGFARAIAFSLGLDPAVVSPTTTERFTRPARRPAYSVLGRSASDRVGLPSIGDWLQRWHAAAPSVLAGRLTSTEDG